MKQYSYGDPVICGVCGQLTALLIIDGPFRGCRRCYNELGSAVQRVDASDPEDETGSSRNDGADQRDDEAVGESAASGVCSESERESAIDSGESPAGGSAVGAVAGSSESETD